MADDTLLSDLIQVYGLGLLFVVGLARLRVPSIVALIAAGMVAGPAAIGIVHTQEDVNTLSEIGVVLLLFTVGLDFSLVEIRRIWKAVVFGGAGQIAGTAIVVLLAVEALTGQPPRVGLFIGLFIALSSTAIVLKEFAVRNQLDSPHGRLATGVLLFQDVALVPLLLCVPILSGRTALTSVPLVLVRAVLAIGVVAVVSRFALPALLGVVSRSGRREAFPLAVLLASIGTAFASSLLGISMALGAFLGGLVLAGSEFSHQTHAEIRPLRDLLAGLFFISLGMFVDFGSLMQQLPAVAVVTAVVVVSKAAIAAGVLWLVGTPLRVAATAGIALAQIGEFSFILGRSGLEAGLLSAAQWQVLLASSIATMMLAPALLAVAPQVGAWIAGTRTGQKAPSASGVPTLSDHVVILGFGIGGQLVAGALRDLGTPYVILDLNGGTVRQARADGEPIVFGDATNPDALASAGVARARAVVAVLSDPLASIRAVKAARQLSATVPIIVRTRYRGEADRMLQIGATIAVAEELEASLEVLAQLFARLDVPGNVIEVLLDGVRRESTSLRPMRAPGQALDALPRAILKTPIATHELRPDDWAVGRTLADVNLRAVTGALVIAVRQDSQYVTSPPTDLRLQEGAVLYLLGDESDVRLARRRLTDGT